VKFLSGLSLLLPCNHANIYSMYCMKHHQQRQIFDFGALQAIFNWGPSGRQR